MTATVSNMNTSRLSTKTPNTLEYAKPHLNFYIPVRPFVIRNSLTRKGTSICPSCEYLLSANFLGGCFCLVGGKLALIRQIGGQTVRQTLFCNKLHCTVITVRHISTCSQSQCFRHYVPGWNLACDTGYMTCMCRGLFQSLK